MPKPTFKLIGNKQEFRWEAEHIHVLVSRIREHRDGRITAELDLKTDLPDLAPHILHTQLNLLSSRSKKDLVRDLQERFAADWPTIIEQLCSYSLQLYRQGQPAEEIWSSAEVPAPQFLITPILYKDKPTMLFGEGGTGKSYFALALCLFVQLPYLDNSLELDPQQGRPLYLDYESDTDEATRRLSTLVKGFGLPHIPILYRECTLPLVDDIDQLQTIVAEHNINFVVIDSLGIASASGNLNDAATATAFYAALRRLKVTSLIITHTSKEPSTKKATPFGSVYFSNLARSVFELRRQQEEGENIINIGLFHRKNNQGPLLPPRGFKISFEPDRTTIEKQTVETVPEFLEALSLKTRILNLLKAGKASTKEIAEQLDANEDTVRRTLNRYKKLFLKTDSEWGRYYNK